MPAVLPHHRTCGSASGGSGNTMKAAMDVDQRNELPPIKPELGHCRVHVTRAGIPPGSTPVGRRAPCPRFVQSQSHQVSRSGVDPFPLPPQNAAQLVTNAAIEVLKHAARVQMPEVGHPAPQERIELRDHLSQRASRVGFEHHPDLGDEIAPGLLAQAGASSPSGQ